MLTCLQAVKKTYSKGELIFDEGDKITSVALILEGQVQLVKDDLEGGDVIVAQMGEKETFAEAFICAGLYESPVSAYAVTDVKILFINFDRILKICQNSCPFHKKLIENIIRMIAQKNLNLNLRVELLSKKTIRERILFYLNQESKGRKEFTIPFSRERMAQYLAVDRSALSRELSKLREEKVIDFEKNCFRYEK